MPGKEDHGIAPPSQQDDYEGQQRAKDTRRTILTEAARLFSAKGYDGCSTRDIAGAAGVSYANIRYHFGDKETLWRKVILFLQSEAYQGDEILSKLTTSDECPKAIFREHTRNAVSYFANQPELPRILFYERLSGSSRLAYIETVMQKIFVDRVGHIEQMQAAGAIRSDVDPVLLNELIAGGLLEKFVLQPAEADRDRLIDVFTDMIVTLVEQH